MPIIDSWLPPTKEHYELIHALFTYAYPVVASAQWVVSWYGMGKTSVPNSWLNIPGRIAWMTMESPGALILLYIMSKLPDEVGLDELPWQNKVLGGLFLIHYSYRAILFPLLQPSMAPIHLFVWILALCFQFCNATSLASWLFAYGPATDPSYWSSASSLARFAFGILIFYLGLSGSFFHDEELRQIRHRRRRREGSKSAVGTTTTTTTTERYYQIPTAGLFRYIFFPHYLCEWVEWLGFWIAAGWSCGPARTFFLNEVFSMLPRAVNGRRWYVERFGEEKVGEKRAIIPGLL